MPRMQDWQKEVHDGLRRENWSLHGPNRIVKVVALSPSLATGHGGYITTGRFLLGKTPHDMELALGLRRGSMAQGASIFRFTRLPMIGEYDYELTALYPDGLAFNPAFSDPAYPPGSRAVHQWKIKKGVQLPVDPINVLNLRPGQVFPYDWLVT